VEALFAIAGFIADMVCLIGSAIESWIKAMSTAYVSVILSWFWELNAKITNYAKLIVPQS